MGELVSIFYPRLGGEGLINLETRGGIVEGDRSSAREWIKTRPIRNCSRRMHMQRPLRGVCVVPRFITTSSRSPRLVSQRSDVKYGRAGKWSFKLVRHCGGSVTTHLHREISRHAPLSCARSNDKARERERERERERITSFECAIPLPRVPPAPLRDFSE